MSVRIEGRKPPFSQFATHCFETPSFSAKSTCLQPRVFLSCRILSPSSVRISSSISFLHFRGVRADAVASGLFSVRTTSASHASACMVPPSPCVAGRRTAFHPQHAPSRSSGKHGVGGNRPHPAFLPDVASAICFCICVCRHTHISSIAKNIRNKWLARPFSELSEWSHSKTSGWFFLVRRLPCTATHGWKSPFQRLRSLFPTKNLGMRAECLPSASTSGFRMRVESGWCQVWPNGLTRHAVPFDSKSFQQFAYADIPLL